MKNIKVSPKFIELAKSNGKRLLCGIITCICLAIPHTGKTEEKVDNGSIQTRIVQQIESQEDKIDLKAAVDGETINITIDLNNLQESQESLEEIVKKVDISRDNLESLSFVFATHWEKTGNYDDSKEYSNGNREYKRTLYRFKANDNFNTEYFNNDIEVIAKFFRDEENSEDVFDIVESVEQVITVTPEEEKDLNTTEDIIVIDGANIVFKIQSNNEEDYYKKVVRVSRLAFFVFYLIFLGGYAIKIFRD